MSCLLCLSLLIPGHLISFSRNFSIVQKWEEIRTNFDVFNEFLKTDIKALQLKEATHILSQAKLSGGGEKDRITEGEQLSRLVPHIPLTDPLTNQQEHEMVTASEPPQKLLF